MLGPTNELLSQKPFLLDMRCRMREIWGGTLASVLAPTFWRLV